MPQSFGSLDPTDSFFLVGLLEECNKEMNICLFGEHGGKELKQYISLALEEFVPWDIDLKAYLG